jgi:CPA1 family monovalent cation:H+ antiporter
VVIVISLVVQGFTLAPLVRRAGIALTPAHTSDEYARARLRLAEAALDHLEQVADVEAVPDAVVDRLRGNLAVRVERLRMRVDPDVPVDSTAGAYRQLRRDLITVESAELDRLYTDGSVSDATRKRIQRMLDLEYAGLGDDA